ncbi:luciferin sulfotransferase-like [Anopheles ziemanni]|uniref:luciferin sulfotransferase-like n=1 Tax=Anopheles coustani TaxID=139045 RepID=UPI00265B700B|nr:luciferin sulfotransferase-like [Anopheles coustani]XP_058173838.1 luciferin sulfotransferase-like [Anopheles ziemanni]
MIRYEKLNNQYTDRIDCPGTEKHYRLTRSSREDRKDNTETTWCVMIEKFLPLLEPIQQITVYEDDVWVITFPKCGTTWTQEMVWLLNNGLDYDRAGKLSLEDRFPFLELSGALTLMDGDSVGRVQDLKRPRHIKSHLPMMLLPEAVATVRPKIIYVSRNPKDAATSFYHHYRNIVGYDGPKEYFFDAFLNDSLIYAPFGRHVRDYWEYSKNPVGNCLFLTYEQMKRDLGGVIAKVSTFLGKHYTESEVIELKDHLSVDAMRNNKSCNMDDLLEWARKTNYSDERKQNTKNEFKFIRSGTVGSYQQDMDEEYVQRFEQYEKSIIQGTDFNFFF